MSLLTQYMGGSMSFTGICLAVKPQYTRDCLIGTLTMTGVEEFYWTLKWL